MKQFLILFLAAGFTLLSEAAEPVCTIAFHPHDRTFTGWEKFGATITINVPGSKTGRIKIQSWEFALCSTDNSGKLLKFQYECPVRGGEVGLGYYGWFGQFSKEQITLLDKLGKGSFGCAILVNGVRCSNVVRVNIDPAYKAAKEPVLRVVPIQMVGVDHVTHLGVWMVPPEKRDARLTNFAAAMGMEFVVDGVASRIEAMAWTGPVGILPSGESYGTIWELASLKPKIPTKAKYKVQAKLFEYESAVEEIVYDPKHGADFDRALKAH